MARMVRTDPRLAELSAREMQFRARLLPRLRDCEAGYGTLLFLAEIDVAQELPRYARDPDADELLAEAMFLVATRVDLGLPRDCLAARYIDACHAHGEVDPEENPGPRRMATQLLHWLQRGPVADSCHG